MNKDDHKDKTEKGVSAKPATTFSPSGAPNQTVGIDVDHPAVDNDPRKDTTADQNRIDFNDPELSEEEAVEKNLKKQQD
jgi:hypothetical protein